MLSEGKGSASRRCRYCTCCCTCCGLFGPRGALMCVLLATIAMVLFVLRLPQLFPDQGAYFTQPCYLTPAAIVEMETILRDMGEALDHFGIRYFIIDGTLIGGLRDGGIIPYDKDIDVAIDSRVTAFMKAPYGSLPDGSPNPTKYLKDKYNIERWGYTYVRASNLDAYKRDKETVTAKVEMYKFYCNGTISKRFARKPDHCVNGDLLERYLSPNAFEAKSAAVLHLRTPDMHPINFQRSLLNPSSTTSSSSVSISSSSDPGGPAADPWAWDWRANYTYTPRRIPFGKQVTSMQPVFFGHEAYLDAMFGSSWRHHAVPFKITCWVGDIWS